MDRYPIPMSNSSITTDGLTGVGAVEALPLEAWPGRWFVAHTRSRNEKVLAQELGRLGIPHYLPLAQRMTRSRATRRISRSLIPVFPGYVFFNGTEEQRYQALTTNRIANVLLVPNQQQLIVELKHVQMLLTGDDDFFVHEQLQVGEWGRITAGPLAGLEGLVTRRLNKLRLNMNVTILGQSVSVEVDDTSVERIDPPSYLAENRQA